MFPLIGMIAGPLLSGAIDMAGKALGLPPAVTAAAKGAVGVVTGNPMMVVEGATQFVGELGKNPPGKTEYVPPRTQTGTEATSGYAPAKPPEFPEYRKDSPLPADYGKYFEHLKTLQTNLSLFDNVIQKNGSIHRDELSRMATNPKADAKLRESAQFLLDNPHYFNRLDEASQRGWGGGLLGTPSLNLLLSGSTGTITRFDLSAELRRVEADIRQYGLPESVRPSSSKPPSSGGTSSSGSSGGTGSTGGSGSTGSSGSTTSRSRTSGSSDINKILGDKNLSLEQKLERVLEALTSRINEQLVATMKDLDEATDRQAKSGKDSQVKSDQEVQDIARRLQSLQEQKERLNQLMSTFSKKYHEMATVALQNMAR